MKRIIQVALTIMLLMPFCISGYAQTIDPVLLQEMEQHRDNEKIRVFVIMQQQYDRQQLDLRAAHFTTRAGRRDFVVNELKQFAATTQYDLRHALTELQRGELVTEPKVLWIANALYFEATKDAILSLADRNDIKVIGLNEERNWLPDGEESAPAVPNRGIASNVTQVNADQVWGLGYTGLGVVVAVIDTGVNYNHLDLADHLWDGGSEFPHHGYDVYYNDNDPMDDHGHGTHCAGTICGDGTAGTQTGIAPDATLMCVKCFSSSGSCEDSHIISAMQWAVDHGCDILSMSLVGYGHSGAEQTLIRNTCVNVLTSGVIASIAAGNEGDDFYNHPIPYNVGLPGGCPPPYLDPDQMQNPGGLSCSVCVGAVDSNDEAANFTSHGPRTWVESDYADYLYNEGSQTAFGLIRPDVCAPGVDVNSADYNSINGYTTMSGTSMATPCVAGCMALMLSKNLNATPEELSRVLEETAVPLSNGKSNIYGCGRVNALAAVNALSTCPLRLESYAVNDSWGNDDGQLNAGESVTLDLALMNDSEDALDGVTLVLFTASDYVTITNGTATLPHFDAGQVQTIDNVFEFSLGYEVPGNSAIRFVAEAFVDGAYIGSIGFSVMVYGYVLRFDDVTVLNDDDGDGSLEPGETADLHVVVSNIGNDSAISIWGTLSTLFPYLTINEATGSFGDIEVDGQASADFNVSLADSAPENYMIELSLDLFDDNEKHSHLDFELLEGIIIFADPVVKSICVTNWDTNGDGELSYQEAAVVTDLNSSFVFDTEITSFDELQYFIGLSSINDGEFVYCESLTSIKLPNSVTVIGNMAFYGCYNLRGLLTIPDSVISIGDYAFYDCSSLTSLDFGSSVTSIGSFAFSWCSGLEGMLTIPTPVIAIGDYAFHKCSGLTSLTISNSVELIGDSTFYDCNIYSITCFSETPPEVNNSFVSEGSLAAYDFNAVSVFVPCGFEDAYASLSWGGFSHFIGMCGGSVTVAADPEEGGTVAGGGTFEAGQTCTVTATANAGYAFVNWTRNGVVASNIAEYTFYVAGEMALVAHFVPEGNVVFADPVVKSICVANWDTNGDGELSYVEAATVKKLYNCFQYNGSNSFEGCIGEITSFDELQYFIGLSSIDDETFEACSELSSIAIPTSVTLIGSEAFNECYSLRSITSFAEVPPSLTTPQYFSTLGPNTIVYVPCGFENAYTAVSWGGFVNILGMCDGTVIVVAYPVEGGAVSGGGSYEANQTCTVVAMAAEGYSFDDWTLNGVEVSRSAEYTFNVAGDMTLVAHFVTDNIIVFADSQVKSVCVSHWDTDGDGELSYVEAAAVTSLNEYFRNDARITLFNELQYFTGLSFIDSYAFCNCNRLTSIALPNSVTSIGECAFQDCYGMNAVYYLGDIHQWCNIQFDNYDSNPLHVARNLFIDNELLTDLVIPETVTEIKPYAFCSALCLTSLTIPNSVTTIGTMAFYACEGLTGSLTIPNSVTMIGDEAFGLCTGFTGSLTLSNSVTYIGESAFVVTGFTGPLNIPNSVTTIGNNAFGGCSGFTGSLTIPNSVTSIGYGAFNGCSGFTGDLIIPNSVTSIEYQTFFGCSGFTGELIIPNSVTTIDNNAFSGCSGFTGDLIIPNSVTTIGAYAFYRCSGFNGNLIIPNSVTTIGYNAFERCSGFTGDLIIPNSVTRIPQEAFSDCSGFTGNLTISNSVTIIDKYAFSGCSGFTGKLTIGNSVTSIGYDAFEDCSGITSMTVLAETPPSITSITFLSVPRSIPVYVPCGCVAAYRNNRYWKQFTNIQESCMQQTVTLTEGWNWVSLSFEMDPVVALQLLEEALGDHAEQIKARNGQYAEYDDEEEAWFGNLTGLTSENMYMIYVSNDCTMALEGTPVSPTYHEITIVPGWNWIGFPCTEEMSVAEAFAAFEAEEDDELKGRGSYTTFDGEVWFGGLTTLQLGQGYMYYSNSTETKTLVLPMGAK
ncbi:MAG: leucine-rich repeat protein [Bacteroidales bacterium]|nr:leucine-rich repeat protein [Bacteroidales bacterium]